MSTKYRVVKEQNGRRITWAIQNQDTQHIMEGGFSTRYAAQEYIWKEYSGVHNPAYPEELDFL